MPWEWHDLMNPLFLCAAIVWLMMEMVFLAIGVVVVGLPLLFIVNGICQLVREMRGKR